MNPIEIILRFFRSSEETEREIESELRFHIEMRMHGNVASGMEAADAKANALQHFGDYEGVKATCRDIRNEKWAGSMNMRLIKGLASAMLGCGLTLQLTGSVNSVRQVGQILFGIAILWRLLIYLREAQPDQKRHD